ncbi:hypothetical protein C8J57DRAFT_1286098 [Mycena rebaudengoi]|nr:hypothetical protein C8J57DRAFT_1286098 [Mycena rebaudengoi]
MPHKRKKRPPVNALPHNEEATASTTSEALSESLFEFPTDLHSLPLPSPIPPPPAWLHDVDVFFRDQAEACTRASVATLDATVAATRAHMARLEARVAQARAMRRRTEQERMTVALLRWRVAATALHALDAHCWGCPFSRAAHGVYENWAAVRAANDWEYLFLQPPQIHNTYRLLIDEKNKWDYACGTITSKEASLVSAHAFFRLCVELGIPAEVQLEMVAAERSEGGSFFTLADQS